MPKKLTFPIIFIILILLNITARLFTPFADFHRNFVFPVIMNIFSRTSGIIPFSVGEILILTAIISGIFAIISFTYFMTSKKYKPDRKKIANRYSKTLAIILVFILGTGTFNYFLLHHCSTFGTVYGIPNREHTADELFKTAVMVAGKANEASNNITRNEQDRFVITTDLYPETKAAMQKLGETYPAFKGYYPNPKPMLFAKTATRLRLLGIYFPFTMEANYNPMISDMYVPFTICHEFAHLKGWMPEDEANFIAYLACIYSDNPDLIYSGYTNALGYLWTKVKDECPPGKYNQFLDSIDNKVWDDIYQSHDIFREASAETVGSIKVGEIMNNVSETVIDANLIIQGVPDGSKSYGRFVDLILNYYDIME